MDVGLVCDSCSTFNPMGAGSCSACGTHLSLDAGGDHGADPSAVAPAAPPATTAGETCPRCRAPVPPSFKFCGACGALVDVSPAPAAPAAPAPAAPTARSNVGKKTMFFGAMQATRAKLVLIKGDGLDGISYTLAGEDHVAGREEGELLFDEDPFLSPVHANFFYRGGQLVVRDEGSTNGVYLRIRGSHEMRYGDRFLVGEQLLEVQPPGDNSDEPGGDGTYFFASPRRQSRFRLLQILRGGDTGLAYRSASDAVSLGREGNDIDFPDDPFISGHHAQVTYRDGRLTLTDLNSKNGTFIRVNHEQTLSHGDYVFMGQQLLRVEIV